MFKRKTAAERGREAFDRCDAKVVAFGDYAYDKTVASDQITYEHGLINLTDGIVGPRTLTDPNNKDQTNIGYNAGHEAVLHCPRTEDDRVYIASASSNHATRQHALQSVRELAGALVCVHCRFSKMTPAQVAQDRAEFLRAEADRLDALTAHERALKDLREIQAALPPIAPAETTPQEP